MFIESIKLKNFRCYKYQEFKFDEPSGKIVDLIEGDTGAGKTSLFNSIGWCLFGKETSSLLGEEEQDLGIPNIKAKQEESEYEVSVELTIGGIGEHADGLMIIKRAKKYRGNAAIPLNEGNLTLALVENGNTNYFEGFDADKMLKEYLSPEFIEFYMFDGEYLAKGENIKGKNLDGAFRRLFKIGSLNTLMQKLMEVSKEYGAKRVNNPKTQELQEEYESKFEEKQNKEEELESLKEEIKVYEDNINKKQEDIDKLKGIYEGVVRAKKIIEELSNLKEEHITIKNKVENARKDYYQAILNGAYQVLLRGLISNAARVVSDANKDADMPPYIKQPFLDKLIKSHVCICGRELNEGTDEFNAVLKYRDAGLNHNSQNILSELSLVLHGISTDSGPETRIESRRAELKNLIIQENDVNEKIAKHNETKDKLSDEEIMIYNKYKYDSTELDNLKARLNIDKTKVGNLSASVESLKKALDSLNDRINKASERNKEAEMAKKEKSIADIAYEVISNLSSRLSSKFVQLLEDELNNIIPKVRFMSEFTARIEVGEFNGLSIKVVDKQLDPDKSYLPGAKNQTINILLIAAFTRALSKAAFGDIVPFIVMDHPFSNLATPRKIEIIDMFSTLFQNTKILMLIPPEDFDENKVIKTIDSIWKVNNCQYNKECKAEKVVP